MRISVIAVGSKMPAWVEQGVDEYCRRLPRELKLQWREIPLARRSRDARPEQLAELEGEQILKAVPAGDRVIALDVLGKRLSTHDLAGELRAWQMSGDNFSLLIGGPDGLAPQCLQRADSRWSLSDLTLPHPLVRVILAEQLYRAWTITVNHPYHRD
ncbi:MAG: 23S rRNA (pseudouridine(1915)-N(3))-methyltransferase RlmH [Halieaceae bacterium]|nr:23S rRNA (pseudouridine(1915)-N(3))-methyltransferase RlmH [Halieaceae bacterium]MCP5205524.1 23S rRNA (pseudouridine(1915)-N(3))-methyltransferase RlmH [Pseudomonadales bacterium]